MINQNVKKNLKECMTELRDIEKILNSNSMYFNRITKYLTNYAIIKACGTIEFSIKCLIADYFSENQSEYINNFLSTKVRDCSANPDISFIHNMIKSFDEDANKKFKRKLNEDINKDRLIQSLNSLKTERNSLAHGKATTISLINVLEYFKDSKKIISILDEILYDVDLINFCTIFSHNN